MPRLLLTLTGTGVAGDALISLVHGNLISGSTALAMVIIFFALLRRIDGVNAKMDVFRTEMRKDIDDIKRHLGEITKTVIKES